MSGNCEFTNCTTKVDLQRVFTSGFTACLVPLGSHRCGNTSGSTVCGCVVPVGPQYAGVWYKWAHSMRVCGTSASTIGGYVVPVGS